MFGMTLHRRSVVLGQVGTEVIAVPPHTAGSAPPMQSAARPTPGAVFLPQPQRYSGTAAKSGLPAATASQPQMLAGTFGMQRAPGVVPQPLTTSGTPSMQ